MPAGSWIVASSVLLALLTAFLLRTRAPGWLTAAALALAGAGISVGGLILVGGSRLEFGFLVPTMALFVPLHVRIVLGPFGPR